MASSQQPHRDPHSSAADGASKRTRPGIIGIETEVGVFYLPGNSGRYPSFSVLRKVLFDCLLQDRKAANSGGLKGGYFLGNGGQVHMEIYFRQERDTPILEYSTPECRTPLAAIRYQRAFDTILEETSRRSAVAFTRLGYDGLIVFGKNNRDRHGTGFGCHENYLVYNRPRRSTLWVYALAAPLILLTLLPPFAIFLGLLTISYLAWLLGRSIPPLGRAAVRFYRDVLKSGRLRLFENLRMMSYLLMTAILYPVITMYSCLLRGFALRPFIDELTPFLITRQVFTGTGCLDFRRGSYDLSQRAELTNTIAKIIMFGRRKTIYDLKGLLYDPGGLFRTQKRLAITVGDSNLSDIPNHLKVGTTSLVIEMIEAGERFDDHKLKNPIAALKAISHGGLWKQLKGRSGRSLTALDIQREYLRRAKTFFKNKMSHECSEILERWEQTLDQLSDHHQCLIDTLDWTAKKSMLDQAVREHGNWKVFFQWGKLFHAGGMKAAKGSDDLDDFIQSAALWRRPMLKQWTRRHALDAVDFETYRDLYFHALKIDLRFHELGGESGYQRVLEEAGIIRRLLDDDGVAQAMQEPPPDTRACVRGFYINLATDPTAISANWHEIEIKRPLRHIPLPDPFSYRVPTDDPENDREG